MQITIRDQVKAQHQLVMSLGTKSIVHGDRLLHGRHAVIPVGGQVRLPLTQKTSVLELDITAT